MKHHSEPLHHSVHSSLRWKEKPVVPQGDAIQEKRDMRAEQEAAFQKPGYPDERVAKDEHDQGRTR